MNIQVLVVYATKYGAMAEITEKIGQVLREAGLLPEGKTLILENLPRLFQLSAHIINRAA
ncbi:MAG: hypothetical protein IMY85_03185 [Chloroflexi bacterium]|nr:hypothetical protein [Chloroflexota bacterium]